ncbi:Rho GTPase activating protein [Entamoeba marina]
MVLTPDSLHIYSNEDRGKERAMIPFSKAVFNKKISNQNKFPSDKLSLSFEIVTDKVYQFITSDQNSFYLWLNSIPVYSNFVGVFGYPLAAVTQKRKSGWRFPIPIYRCIEYLRKHNGVEFEGVFRVSAAYTWMDRVKELLNSGQDIKDEEFGPEGIQVASCIIKYFIRELSDGLIPTTYYVQYLSAGKTENKSTRVKVLKRLVGTLPDINKFVLWYLLDYLIEVLKHSNVNQMTTSNLAVCFAPTVFTTHDPSNAASEIENGPTLRIVFETFLDNFQDIFQKVAVDNRKMGMTSPSYPAVVPNGAVSNAVVAEQVATESIRRQGFRRRATEALASNKERDVNVVNKFLGRDKKVTKDLPTTTTATDDSSNHDTSKSLDNTSTQVINENVAASPPSSSPPNCTTSNGSQSSITQLEGLISSLVQKVDQQQTLIDSLIQRIDHLEKNTQQQQQQQHNEPQSLEPPKMKVDFLSMRKTLGSRKDFSPRVRSQLESNDNQDGEAPPLPPPRRGN